MKVAERVKPNLAAEDEAIVRKSPQDWLTDFGYQMESPDEGEPALRSELGSWDEEGRVIAEQVITRFPRLFPYYF
jgi:hypothetical protein